MKPSAHRRNWGTKRTTLFLVMLIVLSSFGQLSHQVGGSHESANAQEVDDPAPTIIAPETATQTETPTPTPTTTATETPAPTVTSEPTVTPEPVTSSTSIPTATATGAPLNTPTRIPTPTATATTAVIPAAIVPVCGLSQTSGVIGQRIRVTCQGYPSGALVKVYWQDIGVVKTFTIRSDGTGTATFLIPVLPAGPWRVRVSDGTNSSNRMNFTIVSPAISISPATATNGTSITTSLRGFAANEQVKIRWYSLLGDAAFTLRTVTVSSTGSLDTTFLVPANAGKGAHRVEGLGQKSGLTARTTLSVTEPGQFRYLDEGSVGCKRIAFIFNIGVGYPLDTGVLTTLNSNNVPATMFLMGWWADQNPAMARRLATDGYVIGSHGYERKELTTLSDAAVIADIQAASKSIAKATGAPTGPWFTPYAAAIDARVMKLIAGQGYMPVGWKIAARDYDTTATEADVYSRVVDNAYDGAIVEFHIDGPATRTSTGRALPRIIATLQARGYTFVTIPEMALRCSSTQSRATHITSGEETLTGTFRGALVAALVTPVSRSRKRRKTQSHVTLNRRRVSSVNMIRGSNHRQRI